MSIPTEKVEYVRRQPQNRRHECHWPTCDRQVPPAMWGCREHWFKLPKRLRNRIWNTYKPGQEVRLDPSDDYLDAGHEVQEWIAAQPQVFDYVQTRTVMADDPGAEPVTMLDV